jgi:hypothetical protein
MLSCRAAEILKSLSTLLYLVLVLIDPSFFWLVCTFLGTSRSCTVHLVFLVRGQP